MANFIDSFNKGLQAADTARANKEEINSVIEQLSEQLSQAVDGRLKIEITQKNEPIDTFNLSPKDFFSRRTYYAIVASNPLAARYEAQELARWKMEESGYPCKVVMPDAEIYCQDKTALENALSRLISTPAAGKALHAVMNQPLKSDEE
ncbi:hypothetical protein D3C78_440300 [compost metagenome]